MLRFLRHNTSKVGQPPGTLNKVSAPPEREAPISIGIYHYGRKFAEESQAENINEAVAKLKAGGEGVHWLNIDGVHDHRIFEALRDELKIHPLIVEDMQNTGQRTKIEQFDDYLFIVLPMLTLEEDGSLGGEQLAIVLTGDRLISVQEWPGDLFDPVRRRIEAGKGLVRKHGADYLSYMLLDLIVDHYFVVLGEFGERIERLETEILAERGDNAMTEILHLKRELILMRRAVWPLREVLSSMMRDEAGVVTSTVSTYLRDVYDHTIQVIDTVESLRDMLSGLLDVHLSLVSNRMNEVMKVLTIIATLFIPLTFVAGIYGMNFDHMPELHWKYSYAVVWGVMIAMAAGLIWYFRKKRWF